MPDRIFKGILHVCIAFFLFTVMYSLNKLLTGQHHPIEIAFYRNVISLLMLLGFVTATKNYKVFKTRMPIPMALRVVIGTMGIILTFAAAQELPMSNATVLFFASTLILPMLAIIFLKEHVGWHRWGAIIIGMIGVVIAAQPDAQVSMIGVALALGAACVHASVQVLIRLMRSENPLTITFYFFLGGILMCGAFMPWLAHMPSVASALVILGIGVSGALGQYFMTSGFQLAPASVLTPFNYTGLLWATLLDVVIWGYVPGLSVYIGAAIIIAAQLYILHREHVHGQKRGAEELLEL